MSKYNKEYYEKNKERILEKNREWNKENRDNSKEYQKRKSETKMYTVRIDKEMAKKFDRTLEKTGLSYSEFVKAKIENFVREYY